MTAGSVTLINPFEVPAGGVVAGVEARQGLVQIPPAPGRSPLDQLQVVRREHADPQRPGQLRGAAHRLAVDRHPPPTGSGDLGLDQKRPPRSLPLPSHDRGGNPKSSPNSTGPGTSMTPPSITSTSPRRS